MSNGDNPGDAISRREVIKGTAVGATAAIAGCSGDSGGNGTPQEGLGERVPTLSMEYWSNLGGASAIMEDSAAVIQSGTQEALGINLEIVPVEFASQVENIYSDSRTHHVSYWYHNPSPDRLDPHEMTRRYGADWAGGNGQGNPANYASCDHTTPAVQQASAVNQEERRELVTEAQSVMSEEYTAIPILPKVLTGAIRTGDVTPRRIGDAGVSRMNPYPYIYSETDLDQMVAMITPASVQTTNFPTSDSQGAAVLWNHLVHSTLVEYDENYELQNLLASNIEFSEDGSTITVELKDASFHNGDPITPEDVKFTYELLWDNPGAYPQASSPDYDSIEVIDDSTVEFNMPGPFPPLVERIFARWGILHKGIWLDGDARSNPEEFTLDPIVGSGPFEVTNLDQGRAIELTPFDDHPVHSASSDLYMQAYRDQQAGYQAFSQGDVHIAPNLSPQLLRRIEDEMDNAETYINPGFMYYLTYPQHSWSPSQFQEFREAWGASIDRNFAMQRAIGNTEKVPEHSTVLGQSHPYRPPDEELTELGPVDGDAEMARQALEDAGWGWDNEGRLHYPEDKDLSPRWPEGETPDPEEFSCLGEDGEYLPVEER